MNEPFVLEAGLVEITLGFTDVNDYYDLMDAVERVGRESAHLVPAVQDWASVRNIPCVVRFGKYARLEGEILTVEAPDFSLVLDFTGKRENIWQLAFYFVIYNDEHLNTLSNLHNVWAPGRHIPTKMSPKTWNGFRFWIGCLFHRFNYLKPAARGPQ